MNEMTRREAMQVMGATAAAVALPPEPAQGLPNCDLTAPSSEPVAGLPTADVTQLCLSYKGPHPEEGWPLVFDLNRNLTKSTFLRTYDMKPLAGLSSVRFELDREAGLVRFTARCWPTKTNGLQVEHRDAFGKLIYTQHQAPVEEYLQRYGKEHYWLASAFCDPDLVGLGCQDFFDQVPIRAEAKFTHKRTVAKSTEPLRPDSFAVLELSGTCELLLPTEWSPETRELLGELRHPRTPYQSLLARYRLPDPDRNGDIWVPPPHFLVDNLGKHWSEWTFWGGPMRSFSLHLHGDKPAVYCWGSSGGYVTYPSKVVLPYSRRELDLSKFLDTELGKPYQG